jgi:hypothetical protein
MFVLLTIATKVYIKNIMYQSVEQLFNFSCVVENPALAGHPSTHFYIPNKNTLQQSVISIE